MNDDDFTTAARAEAETRVRAVNGTVLPLKDDFRDGYLYGFERGAEWARDYLAAQEQEVAIRHEEGRPATCEVRRGGVLIFSGRDHSADLRSTEQEPTDAEVEAARAAYWPAYSEAVRNAPSNKPGQGISAEDGRRAGLAGHRAALIAARKARP